MFREIEITAAGRCIHSRVTVGEPRPGLPDVVMVHGLGLSGRYMEPVSRAMRHECRIWLPDLPGFGDSEKPHETVALPQLADALAHWTSAAAIEAPVLMANSFGCQIAIEAAVRHPGLASALILQGPTAPPDERSWWRQFRAWRRNGPFNRPGMDRVSWEDYRKAGYLRILRTFNASLRDRPEDKLARIDVPALVVRGEFDPICNGDWAARVAGGLPRGRLVEIPHVAHTLVWDAPAELGIVALQFIRELARDRRGAGSGGAAP